LYDSKNFTHIDFKSYVEKLSHHLIFACSGEKISIDIDADNIILYLDTMASLGLIMQELLTNSLKYAVAKGGSIAIKLLQTREGYYTLSYSDSGISHSPKENFKGLGIKLIELKTKQLDGKIILDKTKGFCYSIEFSNATN
jgi:two-component sensor histidine kinase